MVRGFDLFGGVDVSNLTLDSATNWNMSELHITMTDNENYTYETTNITGVKIKLAYFEGSFRMSCEERTPGQGDSDVWIQLWIDFNASGASYKLKEFTRDGLGTGESGYCVSVYGVGGFSIIQGSSGLFFSGWDEHHFLNGSNYDISEGFHLRCEIWTETEGVNRDAEIHVVGTCRVYK